MPKTLIVPLDGSRPAERGLTCAQELASHLQTCDIVADDRVHRWRSSAARLRPRHDHLTLGRRRATVGHRRDVRPWPPALLTGTLGV